MKISTKGFCGLSKQKDLQSFLSKVAPDLSDELIAHLQKVEGCSSNKKKMVEIYQTIMERGLENDVNEFVKKRYPHLIIKDKDDSPKQGNKPVFVDLSPNDANYHRVFKIYKPGMLLIPQRKILVCSDKRALRNKIINFCRSQLSTDYIILEGPKYWHGYIEYLEKRYINEVDQIDKLNRPIFLYRQQLKSKLPK